MGVDSALVAWAHASVGAFLFQGVRKGTVTGVSGQTVLAMATYSLLALVKKFWYPISFFLHGTSKQSRLRGDWFIEVAAWSVDAIVLVACLVMVVHKRAASKTTSDDNDDPGVRDDFGRLQARCIWFWLPGKKRAPPIYLHWALIYLCAWIAMIATTCVCFTCSLSGIAAMVMNKPTRVLAIFINYLRGVALLPQLHLSRQAGVVCPVLSLWIAMLGVVDLGELLADGIYSLFHPSQLFYTIADILTLLLVSDFMWLFIKSKMRGQKTVEIPLSYVV